MQLDYLELYYSEITYYESLKLLLNFKGHVIVNSFDIVAYKRIQSPSDADISLNYLIYDISKSSIYIYEIIDVLGVILINGE